MKPTFFTFTHTRFDRTLSDRTLSADTFAYSLRAVCAQFALTLRTVCAHFYPRFPVDALRCILPGGFPTEQCAHSLRTVCAQFCAHFFGQFCGQSCGQFCAQSAHSRGASVAVKKLNARRFRLFGHVPHMLVDDGALFPFFAIGPRNNQRS